MPLVNTKEMFAKAYNGGYAIGAFNVNNMEIVQGITEAAAELNAPLILQVSKGARAYANHTYLMKLVEAAIEETGLPICLHLDHGDTFELCKSCIDGGFTSVMIDASSKPFEENIALTRQVVEYAHYHGVVVEAELGTLAGIAAGKPGGALRSAALMNSADAYGLTWFSNIRTMKEAPERNEIDLREVLGTNMIWIPKQDYALVRDHLAARLPEKAKDGRNGRMWKRLGLAFVISVAVNACCGWINYTVFQQTNRMPIARTVASPGSGILAMTGIGGWSTYYTGAGLPGHPEWKYGLQFDAMLALFTVIALAILLFAAMSVCGRLARLARGDR